MKYFHLKTYFPSRKNMLKFFWKVTVGKVQKNYIKVHWQFNYLESPTSEFDVIFQRVSCFHKIQQPWKKNCCLACRNMTFRLKNAVGNMSNSLCVKLHRNNYRYIFSSGKELVKSHSQIILEKEKSLNFSAETQIDT